MQVIKLRGMSLAENAVRMGDEEVHTGYGEETRSEKAT
jgi:hypothetical protein